MKTTISPTCLVPGDPNGTPTFHGALQHLFQREGQEETFNHFPTHPLLDFHRPNTGHLCYLPHSYLPLIEKLKDNHEKFKKHIEKCTKWLESRPLCLTPKSLKTEKSLAPVAHACNPSYSGGRDHEDHGLKPTWESNS
jgi:hypothetical protein